MMTLWAEPLNVETIFPSVSAKVVRLNVNRILSAFVAPLTFGRLDKLSGSDRILDRLMAGLLQLVLWLRTPGLAGAGLPFGLLLRVFGFVSACLANLRFAALDGVFIGHRDNIATIPQN